LDLTEILVLRVQETEVDVLGFVKLCLLLTGDFCFLDIAHSEMDLFCEDFKYLDLAVCSFRANLRIDSSSFNAAFLTHSAEVKQSGLVSVADFHFLEFVLVDEVG